MELCLLKCYISCNLFLYWLVSLKRDAINVFLQVIYFQKVFYVCCMEVFMYSSMLCQLKVYNIDKELGESPWHF